MIHASNVPNFLWVEAINTTVYIINRVPIKSLHQDNPHEVLKNKKLDISHLRIFGSSTSIFNPKDKRKKFDPTSFSCIFVGYGYKNKGLRFYDPFKKEIIKNKNFQVLERNFSNDPHEPSSVALEIEPDISYPMEIKFQEVDYFDLHMIDIEGESYQNIL